MSKPSCPLHGTAHIVPAWIDSHYPPHWEVAPRFESCAAIPVRVGRRAPQHRCDAITRNGATCGRTGLPPPLRAPWSVRLWWMFPERATVEYIMCILVIGFWISVPFWVPILFDRHVGA